jgi:hypothetical protein
MYNHNVLARFSLAKIAFSALIFIISIHDSFTNISLPDQSIQTYMRMHNLTTNKTTNGIFDETFRILLKLKVISQNKYQGINKSKRFLLDDDLKTAQKG